MVETPPPAERHLSRELPSGTVTFLFTDIEGSTRLLDELGDAYAEALAEHRRQLRTVFARHGGIEVDTQGDAFFVAFARASDALTAAAESQQVLEDGPIRVRMGVHTGEPTVTEEGYVGIDVHRAARIAAAGHGGQLLVSQTTYDLAATGGLHDLGEHRLKDLSAPERLYQLGVDDFPPLRTLYQSNLPVPATAFLGREDELAGVRTLLARPEVRAFLPRRRAAGDEPWMARVDAMRKLQAWPGPPARHYHDLAVSGELLLLSIRSGEEDDGSRALAASWAGRRRPEVQRYIHAYKAVAGVNLTDARGP